MHVKTRDLHPEIILKSQELAEAGSGQWQHQQHLEQGIREEGNRIPLCCCSHLGLQLFSTYLEFSVFEHAELMTPGSPWSQCTSQMVQECKLSCKTKWLQSISHWNLYYFHCRTRMLYESLMTSVSIKHYYFSAEQIKVLFRVGQFTHLRVQYTTTCKQFFSSFPWQK